jgi:virulence factor Mce-like protein
VNNFNIKPSRIAVMVLFSLSCFGLLLFLWDSFGGPVPLKPKGYRVTIPFPRAGQLTTQADVRVSGVPIGKVVRLSERTNATDAEVEIRSRYAPLPEDTRAILRTKTLLGETYIELTPGTKTADTVPEGGRLRTGNVQGQVELDQVFQAFTPSTRADLSKWLQEWSASLRDRAPDISGLAGSLGGFADNAEGVLGVLRDQNRAVRRVIADGSTVFGTLAERSVDIRGIIRDGTTVLRTTAERPEQIRATLAELPETLRQVRGLTIDQRRLFAALGPASRGLQPVAADLPATFRALSDVSPALGGLGTELSALNRVAPRGAGAAREVLAAIRPALPPLRTVADQLSSMFGFLGVYRREFVSSWANVVAATQTSELSPDTLTPLHTVRIMVPLDDETLTGVPRRSPNLRSNPYRVPNGLDDLASGLKAFSCANISNPPAVPPLARQVPCVEQGTVSVNGKTSDFPHLTSRLTRR